MNIDGFVPFLIHRFQMAFDPFLDKTVELTRIVLNVVFNAAQTAIDGFELDVDFSTETFQFRVEGLVVETTAKGPPVSLRN